MTLPQQQEVGESSSSLPACNVEMSSCSPGVNTTGQKPGNNEGAPDAVHKTWTETSSYQLWSSAPTTDTDDSMNSLPLTALDSPQTTIPQKVKSSNVTAFVTLLKALFGVSLLSSPRVLQETGLLLGTLVYILLVGACVTSCWLLLKARSKIVASASENNHDVITYGELGRKLLGAKQSALINFLIVSLHICFGSGLVAVASRQIALVLGWEVHDDDEANNDQADNNDASGNDADSSATATMPLWLAHTILSALLFPIISLLLQFRNVKDLFWICLCGLVVYVVGCVGTMLYTELTTDADGDASIWDVPHDAWEWKWSGIPNFVASTLCTMEGINLALPIANQLTARRRSMRSITEYDSATGGRPNESVPVVTGAVACFGILTLSIAYLGYLGGLGGGEGTKHEQQQNDDAANDDSSSSVSCPVVSRCIDSEILTIIHQLSLAFALVLTLPIILYPSLELLELWADERDRQIRTGRTSSNRSLLGNSWNGFVWGTPSDSFRKYKIMQDQLFGDAPFLPFLHRHWKWRIGHALAVCVFAVVDRQFEKAFVLYKGVGLSLACFLLPCFLFIKAYSVSAVLANPMLTSAIAGLTSLGIVNMVLVGLSVFTEHNFVPVLIHEGPGGGPQHQHEE